MLTIGKLATLADISTDTLRFYEREGLIAPSSKSAGGYRLYDEDAVVRLRFIKQARDCGFTLTEIQQLLLLRNQSEACCGDVRQRAIEKKLQLEAKIRALSAMSKALDHLIADCANESHPINGCPILASLEQATASTEPG
ncbi:heavy metal-responsive transcriptional regulator [Massilia sp. Mn16-1_5]|uniref:heavy metal-responsive transcriptional regulator n=1 Tax=Massilia sp. Mn16-1_5 TaxID=2079199 RepID=UPI00109E5830|nr:heavy metal-responsive transcriptional regulator [Massilia sp. Mn16-1_5]THC40234.1 heavy metal-responsive transcriptional regulator [Massilia sp. Mn16-1_5]